MIFDLDRQYLETFEQILIRAGLPTEDIRQVDWLALIGQRNQTATVGVAGIQQCGNHLLLRSVVVERSYQGKGLASVLVNILHQRAQDAGYANIYLLTLDAAEYFRKKFDYKIINRTQAPEEIARSGQFLHICPASAMLMNKTLIDPVVAI